jgi:prevent-host-death family protein
MQKQYSISVAKNKLPTIIHSVEDGSAVELTRHGKPVAVLVSFVQYQGIVNKNKDFWTALTYFKKSFQKEEPLIEDRDFDGLRDGNQGRDVDFNS